MAKDDSPSPARRLKAELAALKMWEDEAERSKKIIAKLESQLKRK